MHRHQWRRCGARARVPGPEGAFRGKRGPGGGRDDGRTEHDAAPRSRVGCRATSEGERSGVRSCDHVGCRLVALLLVEDVSSTGSREEAIGQEAPLEAVVTPRQWPPRTSQRLKITICRSRGETLVVLPSRHMSLTRCSSDIVRLSAGKARAQTAMRPASKASPGLRTVCRRRAKRRRSSDITVAPSASTEVEAEPVRQQLPGRWRACRCWSRICSTLRASAPPTARALRQARASADGAGGATARGRGRHRAASSWA